jgi:hypothetical protein
MIKETNYIKYFYFTLLSCLILTTSCSNFLEQEPGTQTSITEQLSNKRGVLEALAGIYSNLSSTFITERMAVYADIQGGNLKFTPSASGNNRGNISVPGTLENIYNFQEQAIASNFEGVYDDFYSIINETNLILEFVDALPDATTIEKNQIKAEVLTIRAYSHFFLVNLYSQHYGFTSDASHLGIVYNFNTLTSGITYPSRETNFNTYKYIIEDIKTAFDLYTDSNAISEGPSNSYFNSFTAKALLARVYLYKNDWVNAFSMADDVIKNSGITLISANNYVSEWEKPDVPISETLLEFTIRRDDDGSVGNSLSAFYGYTITGNIVEYSRYVASDDLFNLFEASDVRKNLFFPIAIPTLIDDEFENKNYLFTNKFTGNPGYMAFRLSEMYLIRAEASFNLNNLEEAKNDINALRSRANASLLLDNNNLEDAIFLERRKELCFEGHLFYDIARNKKSIVRNDGCISTTCNLNYPSPKFILPIPLDNINLNSNLQQNESY